jgi:two-component system NarL family response regulator
MTVIAEANDGREAVELFRHHGPDVTLLDLRMPQMDGVNAIVAIRQEFPEARIIVLTTYDGDEDIYRALQAGAKAYLLKDTEREPLLECIRSVHEGKTCLSSRVAEKLADRLHRSELTDRELEVLNLMAAGKSNKEVASALCVAEATVKAHVNNILHKFGVNGRTEAVTSAIRRGIVRLE